MDFSELGMHLAYLRKNKKISQVQLALDIGVSRATISSLENGKSIDVGCKKVLQIIDYLGYDIVFREKSKFPTFEELKDER